MLVLFETPAGHALFKLLDSAKLSTASATDVESESAIKKLVRLKAFQRFEDTTAALAAATALVESKPSKDLRKFLKAEAGKSEELCVGDVKLGAAIKEKTGIQCVFSQDVANLMRGIRSNIEVLLEGSEEGNAGTSDGRKAMVLGLAHSLSRYKLKFSPDKVDQMIISSIGLLDEIDKEINTYAMRLREWYGWHFPEMGKIIAENVPYARSVDLMGMRTNAKNIDFSSILPEETEEELKEAAEISMGTEISDEDILNIKSLVTQVVTLSEYRMTLYEYLRNRMTAIAPNLTVMVGELVGARLIAHAGSLLNLAKYPASTVQILGAEKALFRALKTKHATPKYGLLYHASLVGSAAPKHKGKISRSLASKCSLAIRVDALGDNNEGAEVGEKGRMAVEARLRQLDGKQEFAISKLGRGAGDRTEKAEPGAAAGKKYNEAGDMVMPEPNGNGKSEDKLAKKEKKSKKKSKSKGDGGDGDVKMGDEEAEEKEVEQAVGETTPKKVKKEKKEKREKNEKKSSSKKDKRKRESTGGDDEKSSSKSDKKSKKKRKGSAGLSD